jgi:SAM-dependent methyltransferase
VRSAGLRNVVFEQADIFNLPIADETFDHIFVCFVLEHLADPMGAMCQLKRVLKRGGTITLIEGDHGSFYCHPDSPDARRNVDCLVRLQATLGGDACIGRRLFPLLREAGFSRPVVSPRVVYVDASRPELVEGFSRNTFIAMVRGIREQAIAAGLIVVDDWARGIRALEAATGPDGTFCYTFFRALALRT